MSYYQANAANTATAAANTEVVLTIAAATIRQHAIKLIEADYSATPAAPGVLTVESPSGTVLHRYAMTGTTRKIEFPGDGLRFGTNAAVVVRLTAGGAGVIGYVNVVTNNEAR